MVTSKCSNKKSYLWRDKMQPPTYEAVSKCQGWAVSNEAKRTVVEPAGKLDKLNLPTHIKQTKHLPHLNINYMQKIIIRYLLISLNN